MVCSTREVLLCAARLFIGVILATNIAAQEAIAEEVIPEEGAAEDGTQQAEAPATPRVGSLDPYQQAQMQLAKESPPHEVVWLEASYPEREEKFKVLALQQPPRAPQAQGAVLLLHDLEQHADWPYLIRPLRQSLPEDGWYTLAVNLPDRNPDTIPERTRAAKEYDQLVLTPALRTALQERISSTDEVSPAGEEGGDTAELGTEDAVEEIAPEADLTNESEAVTENVDIDLEEKAEPEPPPIPYAERALAHLKAAINHIDQEGYQNIILLAYRGGANAALDYIQPLAASMPATGFALVMIDPDLQSRYEIDLASAFGKKFKPPVLDIYNSIALEARDKAARRASQARMAEMANYRQIKLNVRESSGFQDMIIRRVKSWMMTQAPGMSATKMVDRRR